MKYKFNTGNGYTPDGQPIRAILLGETLEEDSDLGNWKILTVAFYDDARGIGGITTLIDNLTANGLYDRYSAGDSKYDFYSERDFEAAWESLDCEVQELSYIQYR